MRQDGRKEQRLRKIVIRKGYLKNAFGSCLIEIGYTRVICAASIEEKVPPFLRNQGKGWLTAEYGMIPASCAERVMREAVKGRPSGRSQEIQRLIGRSLRAVVDLGQIGERTIWIDADVVQADGGTRTAAITGGFIALAEAIEKLKGRGHPMDKPIKDYVGAVSVGLVEGRTLLDLCYEEDSKADVDMNIVMTGAGRFVEIQGTAEGKCFTAQEMQRMLGLARKGILEIIELQKKHVRI